MEEKEEYEILCLKTPLVSAVHLDLCDFGGRQDRGAPSLGEEPWKRGIGYLDRYDSGGRQERGAPSPDKEPWKRGLTQLGLPPRTSGKSTQMSFKHTISIGDKQLQRFLKA